MAVARARRDDRDRDRRGPAARTAEEGLTPIAAAPYSPEPVDPDAYTRANDRLYTRFARLYDVVVKATPAWRRWLGSALPEIHGPRVLEVSFGTGWLLTRYAGRFRTDGVDLNPAMLDVARRNLDRAGLFADLRQGDVEHLPYPDATFDTVVNTMAFTGYPDAAAAASELARVLKPGGRLVLVDIGYPADGNRVGTALVNRVWKPLGDLVRDMPVVLSGVGLEVRDDEVGGWGSVHRYLATKPARLDDVVESDRTVGPRPKDE
ncbi:class I SAM-dependent methyltransferase [Actinotalea sp. M2MS4P-6]|uniref:class I SAM-dependent methyltransferase n=1 Tax=Actinotalea sp. M2MS4P-6 TaxID=2983762 RepID=UPI0021E3D9FA|nr:class I SAM-dependent methyltransferase [Actinotalea sp. M2MS4P-6]MCV2393896.1 class I SAM-dependent methyltransferase [Actinotalea sp. M2MS4P-6]